MNQEQGLQLKIGDRVVQKSSGMTGEIRDIIPGWGVEVWNYNRNRERWWWDSITVRIPRKIKRYPRPFRFPRLRPTKCCHCRVGRMVVIGENKVKCTKCKFLIGNESFPNRIARASGFLRKAEAAGALRKRRTRKKVARRKDRKISHPRKAPNTKLRRKKNQSGVGIRKRGGEEKGIAKNTTIPTTPIPPIEAPSIPTAPQEVQAGKVG